MDSGVDACSYNMSCRTSGSFTKKRNEGGDGRSSTTEECDSTTEPPNPKVQFQVGDDVYYQEDTGQNVLGTVGLIQGKKIKIIFMDETEKWAPLSRLKKISFNFAEDEEEVKPDIKFIQPNSPAPSTISEASAGGSSSGVSASGLTKKKGKNELNGHVATPKENYQVTCGSCGTQKMIAPKKAVEFSPYTTHQFNCRKCINKSKTNKNNGVPILAAHYLAAARGKSRGSATNGAMTPSKGIVEHPIANGVFRPDTMDKICLHCRSPILERVSLHCTMCERPCHPSCLALTPPPLPGDTFWSIICHVCGTQKPDGSPENDSQKLYSSRRSITCWSDVALLLLSCLGCRSPNAKFFHLDEQVIPFWHDNVTRLHLPRQYKTADPIERRRCLLVALKNAHLRFVKEQGSGGISWGILEKTDLNMVIKPPLASAPKAVTATGFPKSVRACNPEAASAAMTNIAQTIGLQAATNKNNVPSPKNSPSHVSSKSSSNVRQMGTTTTTNNMTLGKKLGKQGDPVAKKSGTELNLGVQRQKTASWSQTRLNKEAFTADSAKLGPNKTNNSSSTETLPLIVSNTQQIQNHRTQSQQTMTPTAKHNVTLSPSPGGAARVTGMMISPATASSPPDLGNRMVNCGSYPVRKNGSPVLNKSIRVETVDRKKEGEHAGSKNLFLKEGNDGTIELTRDNASAFTNHSGEKAPVKRKISLSKPNEIPPNDMSTTAKKFKIGLPSSTDVTSKRLPSPPKSVSDSDSSSSSSNKTGQKKAMSPLQKLSDLQRNGGLTVACLKHTETGYQTMPITPSNLEQAIERKNGTVVVAVGGTGVSLENFSVMSQEEKSTVFSTPVKNCHGATTKKAQEVKVEEATELTKEKTSNVTNTTTSTSPRAFKLASVSTPGSSKASTSPVSVSMERRVRPVRLKRSTAAAAQNEAEKQSADLKPVTKKLTAKGKAAALTAAAVKTTRGRPAGRTCSPLKLTLRKPNNRIVGYHGQFNGSVASTPDTPEGESNCMDESEFSWENSTVKDLLQYGHGFRIGCLPKSPDAPEELAQAALKHLKEELAPRPPSYWSSNSNPPHGKKPVNQKSRRDLKDADSYYISGRRIDQNGIQYQVVWRDGYGFEYSSEDEEELGMDFGENYLFFDDYDYVEYFRDKMPPDVSLKGNCDNTNRRHSTSAESTETSSSGSNDSAVNKEKESKSIRDGTYIFLGNTSPVKVKREPNDSDKVKSKSVSTEMVNGSVPIATNRTQRNSEPALPTIIDLTDSP